MAHASGVCVRRVHGVCMACAVACTRRLPPPAPPLPPPASTLHPRCIHAAPVTLARCSTDTAVTLRAIDWEALGLDPLVACIEQPAIAKLQAARPAFAAPRSQRKRAPSSNQGAGQGVVLLVRRAHGRA